MKYPQLVPVRAVSAISDWLVHKLELLGVDAPLVYSRLLLSLLHTPLQVNALDLAELSHLRGWSGKRKGRRISPSDAEALRRFAAIESLTEVASSDEKESQIEELINELCEKLREIEKQTKIDNDNEFSKQTTSSTTKKSSNANMSEDPRKLYYNAFPALSKKIATDIKTSTAPSSSRSSTCLIWPSGASTSKATTITKVLTKINNNTNSIDTAGVKRRQRRRRNKYGNGKGKQTYTKKNSMAKSNNNNNMNCNNNNNKSMSLWDTNFEGSWEMGHDLIKEFIVKQNSRNRSISESDASKIIEYNDILTSATDKIMKRNSIDCVNNNKFKQTTNKEGTMILRNMLRLTNNKDYYNNCYENEGVCGTTNGLLFSPGGSSSTTTATTTTDTSVLLFGSIPLRDEGYATPDTLTSLSEYDNPNNANTLPRRLYEREVSNESICITDSKIINSTDESRNLALFEAKFNSSVEALWNDGKDDNIAIESTATNENQNEKGQPFDYNLFKLQNTINSFWFNYYKHHYNNTNEDDHELAIHNGVSNGIFKPIESVNDPIADAIVSGMDVYNQSSMPTNLLPFRNDSPKLKTQPENNTSKTRKNDFIQLGTNLISSIWSNNNGSTVNVSNEEDTSLYSKGFWEKNNLQNNSDQQYKTGSGLSQSLGYHANNIGNTNFLKWSDCSFEAPFVPPSTNAEHKNFKKATEIQTVDNYDFKSLPAMSGSIVATQYDKRSNKTLTSELASLQTGYELLFNNINDGADCTNKNKIDVGSSGVGSSLTNSSVTSSIFKEQQSMNVTGASGVASKRHITLLNHSKTSSFSEVIPLSVTGSKKCLTHFCDIERIYKSDVGLNIFKNDQQYLRSNSNSSNNNNQQSQQAPQEEDNLLTSDQTHFRPIRQSYADGYTFDISNSLDDVEFTRSESGSLYFESDKYMQYIPENYYCDDDIGQIQKTIHNSGNSDSPFVLKFCVKQIDKGCQTDSDELNIGDINSNINDEILNKFENESNKISKRKINKKMNYFALPETIINSNNSEDDIYMFNNDNFNEIVDNNKEHSCDLDVESWSLDGIKKKCLNNNNSHTLWGHCATCNNQMNSLPANRLLKDELSADGEEIMSDLRYMQNLYIGSDWEDDDDTDNDLLLEEANEKRNINKLNIIEKDSEMNTINNNNNNDEPIETCYNVKRLISHLLKPETAKSITEALGENQGHNIIKEIVFKDNTRSQFNGTDDLQKQILTNEYEKKLATDSNIFWLKNSKHYEDEKTKEICRNLWDEPTVGLSNNNNCWTNDNNTNNEGFWTMIDNNITVNKKSNENLIKAISESDCIWSYGDSDNNHCSLGGSNKHILINDLNKKWEYSNLESIWKSGQKQHFNNNFETTDILPTFSTANEQSISDNIQPINDNDPTSSTSLLNYYKNDPTYKLSLDKLRQIMDEKQRKLKNCNNLSMKSTIPAVPISDAATVPTSTRTIKTRYDRKRRHSASQNYNNNLTKCIINNCNYTCCQKMKTSFKNNINININNNINNYNICYGEVGSSDGDNNNNINNYNNNIDDGGDLFYDTTTIITCKYWATADTSFTNKKYEGTMTMNPSSILKHVQMVSRPLTR